MASSAMMRAPSVKLHAATLNAATLNAASATLNAASTPSAVSTSNTTTAPNTTPNTNTNTTLSAAPETLSAGSHALSTATTAHTPSEVVVSPPHQEPHFTAIPAVHDSTPISPLKVVLAGFGTEGDVRPMLALAHGLQQRGHSPHVLADPGGQSKARQLGIPFTALDGNMRHAMRIDGEVGSVLRDGAGTRLVAATRAVSEFVGERTLHWMRAVHEASEGADVIVFGSFAAYVALSIAELRDIPAVGAGLQPVTPTREFGASLVPPHLIPKWGNKASMQAVTSLVWHRFRRPLNRARASFGLPPRKRDWTYPIVYGYSPTILPCPQDWDDTYAVCGHWNLPGQQVWEPPAALTSFLNAGEPPIYVGFGSMNGFDHQAVTQAVLGAVGTRRTLYAPGWSGVDTSGFPSNVHVLDPTPHDWLFPQVSVAVYHGGAGTCHAATSAGVPSVIVPFAADQPFWAHRLHTLGVAAPPVPISKLNADRLAEAIDIATSDSVRERTAQVAQQLREEDGVKAAIERIEQWTYSGLRPTSTSSRLSLRSITS